MLEKYLLEKQEALKRKEEAELSGAPSAFMTDVPLINPPSTVQEDYQRKRQEAQDEAVRRKEENGGWRNLLAGFGAAATGDVAGHFKRIADANKSIDEDTIGRVDKDETFRLAREKQINDNEAFNPISDKNQAFRKGIEGQFPQIAQAYGDKWQFVTASDANLLFKPLELAETIKNRDELARQREESSRLREESHQARLSEQDLRRQERQDALDLKEEERQHSLTTPYGLANTIDDAKQLKEAHESKKNFDNKLQDMIDLREKHKGGALLNREDVARGKQLSKDLLLEYKNMAKLGVLSTSDEKIINAIIPEDPLAYDFIPGQDPIRENLRKFKSDSDKDFQTRVQTRIRGKSPEPIKDKKDVSTKVRVSNGKRTFNIDVSKLAEAEKDGYRKVEQ